MAYKYVAYDTEGKVVKGTVDTPNEALAKEALERRRYSVLHLRPARQLPSLRRQIPTLFGVKAQDVITFARLLATLVQRGTTPLTALQLLREQTKHVTFRETIDAVIRDLRQGSSLSEAMSRHPEVFPTIFCRTVSISEETGNLGMVLRRMADYMEKERALLSKLSGAFVYPAFVLLIAAGVVILMITVVLPSFAGLFAELGGELPLPTRILVGLTGFVDAYKLYIVVLLLGFVVPAAWSFRYPSVRRRLDMLLLRIPVIGNIVTLSEMTHFAAMVSTCLSASVPVPETLGMVVKTSRNRIVAEALGNVRDEILKGRRLSDAMTENQVFPRVLVQVVKVGEEAGTLDEDLKVIAETYEADLDRGVNTLVSLLGPVFALIIGSIVMFIAVSVIMPIYSLWGEIG